MCIYKYTLLGYNYIIQGVPLVWTAEYAESTTKLLSTHRHKDTKERIKISKQKPKQCFWYREYCGNFSMAAGVTPAASPKEDYTYTTKAREYPTSCLQSPKAPFFPACFKKHCYLVCLAEQRARQTGWPPLYNWRPYKYILQRPPLSHCTVSALQHWNYLSPSARTDQ